MQNLATPPFSFHRTPLNCPTRTIKPPQSGLVSHCHFASTALFACCFRLLPVPGSEFAACGLIAHRCLDPVLSPRRSGNLCASVKTAPASQPTPPLSALYSKCFRSFWLRAIDVVSHYPSVIFPLPRYTGSCRRPGHDSTDSIAAGRHFTLPSSSKWHRLYRYYHCIFSVHETTIANVV